MFSARAYSFRQKSRLAISLSWIAGYTNVILYTFCGMFVSNTTGNVTLFSKSVAEGLPSIRGTLMFGGFWLAFLLGAASSTIMTEVARRRGSASKYVLPLAIEALLLTWVALGIAIWYGSPHPLAGALIGAMAAVAMGMQNATITKISGAVVRTTHLTGVTTDLGIEGVQYLLWFRDHMIHRGWPRVLRMIRVSRRHPAFLRVALLATIIGSFVFGAVVGMTAYHFSPGLALLFPVGFLCFMIAVDWHKPIADVREIDLCGDQELKLHGIAKSLLPAQLGIWRVFCKHDGQWHKAPDFEQWVERLPKHWRVIVLSISPLTRLEPNALLNLAAAARKLRDRGRRLVLAGITPPHYQAIEGSESAESVGLENLCPDLEFAIARGIELIRSAESSATILMWGGH